jgi:DNA-binding FadR family transcriptional regulator
VRRSSAVDTVRVRFALAIELGLLLPGERLPSVESAARGLEVGAITVRRALALLVADGYVTSRRGKGGGTFVAADPPRGVVSAAEAYRSDASLVRSLIDERAALETGLAFWAADRRSGEELAELRRLVGAMAGAADWSAFHVLDVRFHRVVAEAARLPGASDAHANLAGSLYSYFLPYPIEFLRRSNDEHLALVDALDARDGAAAARLAGEHVLELHSSMYVGLESATGTPKDPSPEEGAGPSGA